MSAAIFLRVLNPPPDEKGRELARVTAVLRTREPAIINHVAFIIDPVAFTTLPASPFAYWVDDSSRRIFRDFPSFEGSAGTVRQGLATADDFRFLRGWWEVNPEHIGHTSEASEGGRGWIPSSKGGPFSPFYDDIELVVNWSRRGSEIKNFYKPSGRLASRPQNEDYYFRPGVTWPLRTHRFSPYPLPQGTIPTVRGSGIYSSGRDQLEYLLAWSLSTLVDHLLKLSLGRDEHPQFDMGDIGQLPWAAPAPERRQEAASAAKAGVEAVRALASQDETSHCFAPRMGDASERIRNSDRLRVEQDQAIRHLVGALDRIDAVIARVYGTSVSAEPSARLAFRKAMGRRWRSTRCEELANSIMWCVGVAFGRWDVRMAKDPSLIPELQGPFERLPRVAPGGLIGPDGLPATRDRIASEAWLRARPNVITLPEPGSWDGPDHMTSADYPIEVAWDGILVDDPGHPRDIIAKVREVLRYVYGPARAQAIEDEALEILRAEGRTPKSLRDWFRNQKATELKLSFFDFHIRRYSKSRRKAPIYWRLCTSPGRGQSGYGVWLYYHPLTDDTLWTVLNEYVGPRREREERRAEELRQRMEAADESEARRLEKEREEAVALFEEIQWFEGAIRKVAEGDWAPDLDDGVVINLAPLHAVVPWKEPEKVWEKVQKGDYDWTHLAMRYWPERVRDKCRTDRSLAIAHELEEVYEEDE